MDEREKLRAAAERIRSGGFEAKTDIGAAKPAHADEANGSEESQPPVENETASATAELEAQKADLTDRLLRAAAELDNLRKRSEREVGDARRYAVSKFAGDMLTVNDNLQRAIKAVPKDVEEQLSGPVADFVKGVEVTSRELIRTLAKHGVTEIEALGEKFDPHLHEALFEVPTPGTAAGTIIEEVEKGYKIGDRILRAAKVGVAKAAPAPQSPSPNPGPSNPTEH